MIMVLECDIDRMERLLMQLRDLGPSLMEQESNELLQRLALARRGYPKAGAHAQAT